MSPNPVERGLRTVEIVEIQCALAAIPRALATSPVALMMIQVALMTIPVELDTMQVPERHTIATEAMKRVGFGTFSA